MNVASGCFTSALTGAGALAGAETDAGAVTGGHVPTTGLDDGAGLASFAAVDAAGGVGAVIVAAIRSLAIPTRPLTPIAMTPIVSALTALPSSMVACHALPRCHDRLTDGLGASVSGFGTLAETLAGASSDDAFASAGTADAATMAGTGSLAASAGADA